MAKVKKTYRLEQETVDEVARLAEADGATATDIIERAVREYGNELDSGQTGAVRGAEERIADLQGQVAYLQEANRELMAQNGSLAESVRASQAVQAMLAVRKRGVLDRLLPWRRMEGSE